MLAKFQDLQKAYQTIMKLSEISTRLKISTGDGPFGTRTIRLPWIRTDVAVPLEKRQPASIKYGSWLLGHPDGRGTVQRRPNRARSIWVMVMVSHSEVPWEQAPTSG
jgi:hypothetical protein